MYTQGQIITAPAGAVLFFACMREMLAGAEVLSGYAVTDAARPAGLALEALTDAERDILAAGCLIDAYREGEKEKQTEGWGHSDLRAVFQNSSK